MRTSLVATVASVTLLLAACNDNTLPDSSATSSSGSSSSGGTSGASGSSGAASSSGSSSGDGTFGAYPCEGGTRERGVRVVTGNLSDGNAQTYDDGTGLRIFKALEADIALVQEMNFGNDDDNAMRTFVERGFGDGYEFYRGSGTSIPNGIVSRFPIVDRGEADDPDSNHTRTFVWARIDVPGDRDVLAISVHLATDAPKRTPQVETLLGMIDGATRDGDLVVLGGDFNTDNRTANGVSRIGSRFDVDGPYPADGEGNENTNISRARPYDWIVADADLEARALPTQIGDGTYPRGMVFDSRVAVDRARVSGVNAGDSSKHQHMAVVRTFAVCE